MTITRYNAHRIERRPTGFYLVESWDIDTLQPTQPPAYFVTYEEAMREEERRADIDIARDRKERGIIAPFQSAW